MSAHTTPEDRATIRAMRSMGAEGWAAHMVRSAGLPPGREADLLAKGASVTMQEILDAIREGDNFEERFGEDDYSEMV